MARLMLLFLFVWLPFAGRGQVNLQEVQDSVAIVALQELDEQPTPLNIQAFLDTLHRIGVYIPSGQQEECALFTKTIAEVLVGPEGRYLRHRIKYGPNPCLAATLAQALPILTFSPPRHNGQPMATWVTVPWYACSPRN